MAGRLADSSRTNEPRLTSFPRPKGPPPKKRHPAMNYPSYKHGNPITRKISTSGKRITMSQTNNESVGVASQLAEFSRQVTGRSQLMASRLADLSQASEASRTSFLRPKGPRPIRKKASRIEQSFLQVWKLNKSNSRHLRQATN